MTGARRAAEWRNKNVPLAPCPFCGNTIAPKLLHRTEVAEDFDKSKVSDAFAVVCDASTGTVDGFGCGGSSGYWVDPDKAAEAWNRRVK